MCIQCIFLFLWSSRCSKVFLQIKGRIRVNVTFITFYLSTSLKWLYQNLMLTKASYITYLAFYPTYTDDSDDQLYCNLIQLEWALFIFVRLFMFISMTSLLPHKLAQPTKWRFLPKNLSQLVIFVILHSLGYEATKIGPNFRK